MKKVARICGGVVLGSVFFILLLGLIAGLSGPSEKKSCTPEEIQQETQQNKVEALEKRIDRQFSAWDGSHINLTKLIKSTMNDPGSYEHIETRYGIYETYLIIHTTYRGKNVFGGVVPAWAKVKVDLNGKIIDILGAS